MQYYLVVMYTVYQQYHLMDIYQDLMDYNLLRYLNAVTNIFHLDLKQPNLQYYSKQIYYHLDTCFYIHLYHYQQLIRMFHLIPNSHILLYQQMLLNHMLYSYKQVFHHNQNVLRNHSTQVLLRKQFHQQHKFHMYFLIMQHHLYL